MKRRGKDEDGRMKSNRGKVRREKEAEQKMMMAEMNGKGERTEREMNGRLRGR